MTGTKTGTKAGTDPCAECGRLARAKEEAERRHDLSAVTDCVVLLRRHGAHCATRSDRTARSGAAGQSS